MAKSKKQSEPIKPAEVIANEPVTEEKLDVSPAAFETAKQELAVKRESGEVAFLRLILKKKKEGMWHFPGLEEMIEKRLAQLQK